MPLTVGIASAAGSLKNPAEPGLLGYRVNLVRNPSFEVNTTDWASKAGSSIERSSAEFFSGSHSLKITLGGSGTTGTLYGPNSNRIPFSPGTYTASAYVKADSGTSDGNYRVRLFLYEIDPNGELLASPSGSDVSVSTSDSWKRVSHTFTLTDNRINYVSLALERTTGASGQIIYADAFLLEKSNSLGTYFDGSTEGGFWSGDPHNSFSGASPYQ